MERRIGARGVAGRGGFSSSDEQCRLHCTPRRAARGQFQAAPEARNIDRYLRDICETSASNGGTDGEI